MSRPLTIKELLPYANTIEKQDLNAILTHGTQRAGAAALGKSQSTLSSTISRVRRRASKQANAPEYGFTHPVPPAYLAKKVTQMYDKDGEIRVSWVTAELQKDNLLGQMEDLFASVTQRIESMTEPVAMPIADPAKLGKDLAVVVPMGDPHVGMYSWAEEAEADFDCETAEKLLIGAVEHLVDVSPPAEEFILINLGDFFHSDTVDNRTAHGNNALDVDGRWAKVQEIGFWIMIRCIDRALRKYPKVTVHNAIGNHDEHTSQALGAIVSAWYRNEPRVNVIRNPSKFWYTQWGKCMIAVHHGHTTKFQQMPLTMASHEPKMWGDTVYRYCYVGHKHHNEKKEFPGATVEQFRTLAPKDAWHWGNGSFISMRDMQALVLHKNYGEIGRRICPVEYLMDDPKTNLE